MLFVFVKLFVQSNEFNLCSRMVLNENYLLLYQYAVRSVQEKGHRQDRKDSAKSSEIRLKSIQQNFQCQRGDGGAQSQRDDGGAQMTHRRKATRGNRPESPPLQNLTTGTAKQHVVTDLH